MVVARDIVIIPVLLNSSSVLCSVLVCTSLFAFCVFAGTTSSLSSASHQLEVDLLLNTGPRFFLQCAKLPFEYPPMEEMIPPAGQGWLPWLRLLAAGWAPQIADLCEFSKSLDGKCLSGS